MQGDGHGDGQVWERKAGELGGVVDVQESVDGEQEPGAAAFQNIRGFTALVTGVQCYHCGPHHLGPEGGDDPLLAVGRPNGDTIPGFATLLHQPAAQ